MKEALGSIVRAAYDMSMQPGQEKLGRKILQRACSRVEQFNKDFGDEHIVPHHADAKHRLNRPDWQVRIWFEYTLS